MIRISDALAIDERAVTESFIRSSGPGGQNVNKVATAVQLRFDITAAALPEDVRARLLQLAGRRVNQAGELVIVEQRYRTQERNREAALEKLIALIRRAEIPPVRRVKTKPSAASRQRRLETKLHRSRLKRTRGQCAVE